MMVFFGSIRCSKNHLSSFLILLTLLLKWLPNSDSSSPNKAFALLSSVDSHLYGYEVHPEVRSSAGCANLCIMRMGNTHSCNAFNYHPMDRTCNLYTATVISQPVSVVLFPLFRHTLLPDEKFKLVDVGNKIFSMYLSTELATYIAARTRCELDGGYLLHVDSLDKYEVVKQLIVGSSSVSSWVGINDIDNEGTWICDKDGSPVNGSLWLFDDGEPNDATGEDCGVLDYSKMRINDVSCDWLMTTLCERDVYD